MNIFLAQPILGLDIEPSKRTKKFKIYQQESDDEAEFEQKYSKPSLKHLVIYLKTFLFSFQLSNTISLILLLSNTGKNGGWKKKNP